MQKAIRKEYAWCASERARRWSDLGRIRTAVEDDIREAARIFVHPPQKKNLEFHSELDGKCAHYHLNVEVKNVLLFQTKCGLYRVGYRVRVEEWSP